MHNTHTHIKHSHQTPHTQHRFCKHILLKKSMHNTHIHQTFTPNTNTSHTTQVLQTHTSFFKGMHNTHTHQTFTPNTSHSCNTQHTSSQTHTYEKKKYAQHTPNACAHTITHTITNTVTHPHQTHPHIDRVLKKK